MLQNNSTAVKPKVYMFKDYEHLAKLFYSGATFVAFDTETTGLECQNDYLTEIGAVKFNCNGEIARYDQLIRPPVKIPPFLVELTHITNEMVENCPVASKVMSEFLSFLGDKETILVAHNAQFDLGFLNMEMMRMGLSSVPNTTIDSLPLARWVYPEFKQEAEKGQYKLQTLAKRFNVEVLSAHRADDDARVLMEIFQRILKDSIPKQKDFDPSVMEKPVQTASQLELF